MPTTLIVTYHLLHASFVHSSSTSDQWWQLLWSWCFLQCHPQVQPYAWSNFLPPMLLYHFIHYLRFGPHLCTYWSSTYWPSLLRPSGTARSLPSVTNQENLIMQAFTVENASLRYLGVPEGSFLRQISSTPTETTSTPGCRAKNSWVPLFHGMLYFVGQHSGLTVPINSYGQKCDKFRDRGGETET